VSRDIGIKRLTGGTHVLDKNISRMVQGNGNIYRSVHESLFGVDIEMVERIRVTTCDL